MDFTNQVGGVAVVGGESADGSASKSGAAKSAKAGRAQGDSAKQTGDAKKTDMKAACFLDRPLRDASEWPGLSGKWAGQLQTLLTRMHSMAIDGFAPSRKHFYVGTDLHPQAHKKFFPTFTEFAHRCGYRSAMEKMCDATRTELVERAAMRRMQAIKNKSDLRKGIKKKGESAFGDPLDACDMIHAPTNEQGVVMLFGMLANELKFVVELVQTGYPDCEAKRQGADGKWRRVLIEFEFRSSNFNHDPRGCDLIVCWEHDTKENEVDVLELKSVMEERAKKPRRLAGAGISTADGVIVDEDTIERIVREDVINRETLEGPEADSAAKRVARNSERRL